MYRRMIVLLALLALACVAGLVLSCASIPTRNTDKGDTVLVENQTLDQLKIYSRGFKLGQVEPGKTGCFYLPSYNRLSLVAVTVIGGTITVSPRVDYGSWKWTISNFDLTTKVANNLMDTDPCK